MDLRTLHAQRWFAGKGRAVDDLSQTVDIGGLGVVDVRYADSAEPERYLVHDDGLRWGALLGALGTGPLTNATGRLELVRGPALDSLRAPAGAEERLASLDQSNTLVVVGDRLLLKEYIAGAASGWEAMISPVAAQLRGERDVALPPLADAGTAAAVLHRVLAERLGTERVGVAGWHAEAIHTLAEACALERSLDGAAAAELGARLQPLAQVSDRLRQRIHGDLNVAQCLFAGREVTIVDFEGNPTIPLERRRLPDTPLRDVATLLCSIDHVGSAAARRAEGTDPTAWIEATSAAVLQAYEQEIGTPADPALLHALQVVAECRELVYAHRVVPEWAYVARAALARLLDTPVPT